MYILCKKIQCNNTYAPWVNEEFIRETKIRDQLNEKARVYNSENDWRIFRIQRNKVNNLNKSNKSKYYNHMLNIKSSDEDGDKKFQNYEN